MAKINRLIMKRFLVYVLSFSLVLGFVSCDNDDMKSSKNEIVLNDLEVSRESITLTWSQLSAPDTKGYLIIRNRVPHETNDSFIGSTIIAQIIDPTVTEYVDNNLPLSAYLEYQIVGVTGKEEETYKYIYSNKQTYLRPEYESFMFDVFDVLPDIADRNWLYITEKQDGIITIFDYETKSKVKSITSGSEIGFSAMGIHNSVKELYVPRADGWLFIYNAENLEQTDKINLGAPVSSVVYNEGYLFISSENLDYGFSVYDRQTKERVAYWSDYSNYKTHLRLIPGSKSEFIDVSINLLTDEAYYYKFDHDQKTIERLSDKYHGEYRLNHYIFRFSPDGKKYVTSWEGVIYDVEMNYLGKIPRGDMEFVDYAFNDSGSLLYCGYLYGRSIVSYSFPGLEVKKQYETLGYPYKIFLKDDNTLVCLSTISATGGNYRFEVYSPIEFFVEKIEL